MQVTYDAQGLMTSILAKFPGSVHDNQVFWALAINQPTILQKPHLQHPLDPATLYF